MSEPGLQRVAVVGAGPAGLMAAEVLASAGVAVDVYDAMPSVGRKFLLAGKGGLNLTHAEPLDAFASRYGERRAVIEPMLRAFGADELRQWAKGLGVDTFVGTSGRVFPAEMKAAPLLRAWLHRLRGSGVRFHMRHRWLGWGNAAESGSARDVVFAVGGALAAAAGTVGSDGPPTGTTQQVSADAVVLALGGASWARLGSDGAWVPWLQARGVDVAPLRSANCGFDVAVGSNRGWSEHFRSRFAGQPFKSVVLACDFGPGKVFRRKGEFVATDGGVEGSLVYAASSLLRDAIAAAEPGAGALLHLDLLPDHSAEAVAREVAHPRGSRSLSSHLKSRLHLDGIKTALLYELLTREVLNDPVRLAAAIKALPLRVVAARPIDEAISSAGGVRFEGMTEDLMLRAVPGVFCAGEMLDWEAPTGGYLLTACFATGCQAAQGVLRYLHGVQIDPRGP